MKKKISITVDEEIYKNLIELWKKEQENSLKSSEPRPVKFSKTAEKVLKRGLGR